MSRARARAIEYARVQSEIKRNNAEAEKMEAEARYFNRSWIRVIIKSSIAGVVTGALIWAFTLDSFKNFYDLTYRQNEILKKEKEKHKEKRLEFEKHYLEMLIRDASFNAYNAYMSLLIRKNYLKGSYASPDRAQYAYAQADQSLHDYWKLVLEIAKETQHELFSEVKQKISDKLKKNEEKDRLPIQRKSLCLIERHVADVRDGNSQFPIDLMSTFINQPELQAPGNKENNN